MDNRHCRSSHRMDRMRVIRGGHQVAEVTDVLGGHDLLLRDCGLPFASGRRFSNVLI